MASSDDSKNVVTDESNEENCEVNETIPTSIVIDERYSENGRKTLASSEDSKNSASDELEMKNVQANITKSCQSAEDEHIKEVPQKTYAESNLTSEITNPSNPGCSVNCHHQEDVDKIEEISEDEAAGCPDSDHGVPGCVYCERERMQRLESLEDEEEPDDDDRIGYCERFCEYMKEFVDSWYMVGILAALMLWAYSVVYAGNACKGQCIFMGNIIDLFTFVGATGFAASGTRLLVMVVQKCLKKNHFCVFLLVAAETFCFVWAYFVLLVFFILHGDTPTVEPGPAYCDLTFYNFMVTSTWVMLGVLILLAVIYVSAYSSSLFKTSSEVNVVSSSRYGAVEHTTQE